MSNDHTDLLNRIVIIKSKIQTTTITQDSMKRILYTCIHNFDYKFYKSGHRDLIDIEDGNLMKHYITNGRKEKRLPCKKLFNKLYPGFDIEYYRNTNFLVVNVSSMSDDEIMCHYYMYGVFLALPSKFN